jgi:hypothetical protein
VEEATSTQMTHALVMNYGLYRKMEIFASFNPVDADELMRVTESKTCDAERDGAVSHGRIRRLSKPHHTGQHGQLRARASKVSVLLPLLLC